MRLEGYEIGDVYDVDARADFWTDFAAAGFRLPEGVKMTLRDETGAIVGVAGFTRLAEPGQVGAWAYLADLSPRQWIKAARLARDLCRLLPFWGWSIYATPADTDEAMRLLGFIGFRPSPDEAGVWKFMGGI